MPQEQESSEQENKGLGPQPPRPPDDEFLVIYLPEWESAYDRRNP